ncbi:MAG: hypothetical protein IIB37_08945 [Gemmatimonadetes bacterium]|nr:hypothetical protein [Gemmatimonadota bacterium]
MSDQPGWEAGTWEGARRLGLRKALGLSVRERLQALEAMAETSERLARIGVSARRDDSAAEERSGKES